MVSVKKLAGWLVIAFVVFYVVSAPESSAELVRSGVSALGDAARQFAQFLQTLF